MEQQMQISDTTRAAAGRLQITAAMLEHPEWLPADAAANLGISELDVVQALPAEQQQFLPLEWLEALLQALPEWGKLTTIVTVAGQIFEFKGDFPKGKTAHGYFNLYSKGDGLHGHLKLENFSAIALISRPFRGTESHSINFFGPDGAIVFKVYLGRDQQRKLLPPQLALFADWRHRGEVAAKKGEI
ncbi:heme utilization cystosolic carrier protein HutX [Shewanella algae]|jgi:hypothetical protein|nr:heme utilization cystosolic carrier protein HutX [Shewanella algae]MBO2553919.1 heme utilization cystosolic carrier protein HutX [Shewanella algae]MBO2596644.1 heme utilization cystosolic carrier protein HutX [Shewanella algae]MBO2609133.1 heme utilization cystosolic carrier protein HutX [Shewanella algae]MBO2630097.1 heme utilization cystosolic carrier protein HutX [Shewanella algae]